jgi:hypothetical protein
MMPWEVVMQTVEGKKTETHVHKQDGMENADLAEYTGDQHYAVQADLAGADKLGVSSGRTIELAQYEFARVDFGINVHFKNKAKADELRTMCQEVVNEMLAREENMIAGGNRANRKTEWNPKEVFGCSIYVAYGLTLKGSKRFESHRMDISRLWQVDDDADFLAEIEKVSEWVVEGVKARADKIRGLGGDTGI